VMVDPSDVGSRTGGTWSKASPKQKARDPFWKTN
jgi:hypothetical protein